MAAMSVQLVGDLKVLQWDAIFTAAGISASSLEDQIDFTDWFCKVGTSDNEERSDELNNTIY